LSQTALGNFRKLHALVSDVIGLKPVFEKAFSLNIMKNLVDHHRTVHDRVALPNCYWCFINALMLGTFKYNMLKSLECTPEKL